MKLKISQRILVQAFGALGSLLIGVLTIWIVAESHAASSLRIICIAYAVAMLWLGLYELRRVRARKHGISVERKAFSEVIRVSRRFGLIASHGAYKPSVGDIDLILSRKPVDNGSRPLSDVAVAIEIKAYERFAPDDQRMVHAAAQAQRAASSMNTPFCILWLPKAKPTLRHRIFGVTCNGVPVVLGRVVTLVRRADAMLPKVS